MKATVWLVGWAAVLGGALAASTLGGEQVAPELPVAAWAGGSVGLEDFKGQTTAVVFFDDRTG